MGGHRTRGIQDVSGRVLGVLRETAWDDSQPNERPKQDVKERTDNHDKNDGGCLLKAVSSGQVNAHKESSL